MPRSRRIRAPGAAPQAGAVFGAAAALALSGFLAQEPACAQSVNKRIPPHSISTSRQFVVYAETPEERSALAATAEEIKFRLRRALGLPQSWRTTVSIVARRARSPEDPTSARFRLTDSEAGPLIRIDITAGREPDTLDVRARLVDAVLADIALSGPAAKEWRTLVIPPWLSEGLVGLLEIQESGHPAASVFAGMFEANRIPPLAEFLEQKRADLEGSGLELYRGFATTLVRLLLEGENGRPSMVRFIESLPTGKLGGIRSLNAFFPRLGGSAESAQKWWALAFARLAARQAFGSSSVEATEKDLAGALILRLPRKEGKPETLPFAEAAKLRRDRGRKEIFQAARLELQRVALRAHPLMQPAVLAYIGLLDRAAKGDFKNFEAEVKKLETLREEIRKRAAEIEDHLNWFEATQIPQRSGAFKGYFDLLKKSGEDARTLRDDPLSRYLDRMELELQ